MESDQMTVGTVSDAAVTYTVSGTVTSLTSAGVGGLTVQIVDKNAGPDVSLTQATTKDDGSYSVSFNIAPALLREHNKTQPDLQARVLMKQKVLAASTVAYNAPTIVILNIVIPASVTGLPSEYEALTRSLSNSYTGKLGALQENGERTDITYLANKTGWDARAVALAALADQFSTPSTAGDGAGATGGIPAALYYALFRAGMPANAQTLYRANLTTVSTVWHTAITQGVIPASLKDQLTPALAAFHQMGASTLLDAIPVPNTSSVRSLLQLTLGTDTQRQQQFADLYTQYQNDLPSFWAAVQKAFGQTTTQRLQLDGQLSYLTINNAPLMSNLHQAEQANPPTSLLDLVRRGYYQASKWQGLMNGVSVEVMPGTTLDEKEANYISLLTTQLRLSYPTAVLAEMINTNAVPLTTDATVRAGVYQFFVQNQDKYELGLQPLDQYLLNNSLTVDPTVVAQVKRLQRVYQVTPSDTAMNALLSTGVDSAYAIAHYGQDAFVRAFEGPMGSADIAMQTFAKGQSVYNAVLNVTTDYLSRRVMPVIGNGTGRYVGPFPTNGNGSANPSAAATLETLFGSMDYCQCDECRSILGPAAYLVDLLNLTNAQSPPAGTANPQNVLFARRPDLQYLLLTCDNTNTAQPYIDLVNETLEYFAANGSMASYQGFQTDATATPSPELIAAPQNVNNAAYTILQSAMFPPPLPFDRSLEILRLLFQKFDVSLQDAMAALRPSDAIERPAGGGPTAYGWRDILMEEVGLSRAEYQILTDSTLTLNQLYGYPASDTQAQVITALSSVQDYARRFNVAFDDLVSILETHFINPFGTLTTQLESLYVPFSTIAALKNGTLTPAQFLAQLPTGPSAPNPADFGGDIVAWLTDPTRYAQIMGLITLANPNDSTDLCSMSGLQFRYSNPDNTANVLQPIDFVRMLRFIRLWQKLGLTVEQTDDIITTLAPTMSSVTTLTALDSAFLSLLPRIGFAYRVLTTLGLSADTDLERMLPCWGPISVYGTNSLYATMFLNPTMLRQDPAFAPDVNGNVLQDTTQTVMATPTLQKAVVSGTVTVGDVMTTTLNGISVPYTVVAGDTSLAVLASHIAAAVNATVTKDPVTNQALNAVISATSNGAAITLAAIGTGGAFTLVCSVSPGSTETYLSLDHAPALRAAFNLTASEFALITNALGFNSTTILNIVNISAIYCRGWLARQLEISVDELLLLVQYSGLNPFAPPDPSPTPPAEPPAVQFIRLVQAMSNESLQPVQALYLLWNQDISGTSAPTQADINALAFTLRSDFAAVDAQFTLVDDPTGAIATSLMTLVYGSTATNFFFGLLNNTLTVSTPYGGTVPAAVLTASSGRLTYDNLAKELSFAGVLDTATLTAMETAAGANPTLLTALSALLSANQAAVNPFFAQYPELLTAYTAYATSAAPVQAKRTALLANLLPSLEAKRKQEQALASVSAAAGIDASFATALFTDATVMHAAADPSQPSTIDLTAIEAEGLSAAFFLTNNTSLAPDQTIDNAPALNYAAGTAITLPPGSGGGAIAGIWSGYLDCPQDGFYNFSVTTEPSATVALVIGGQSVTMSQSGGVFTNASPVSLIAGSLTSIALTVTTVKSTLLVSWQSAGTGWQTIPGQYLYSQTIVGRLGVSYTRYLKGASLATAVSLDANELTHLATDADYQVTGVNWLNALPVSGSPDGPTSSALANVLTGALTFARLKAALSPKDERVLAVLENPAATLPSGSSALLTLTRWDATGLNALLTQFFGSSALTPLAHLANLARVFDAFGVVTACGIAASSLLSATTNAPGAQTVIDFEAAVRARYAESDWLTVIKPINDSMRQMQRDALVPYVLQLCAAQTAVVDINTPVNTADTLFEYLLMDVEMQPCMLTSRIRLALSAVQLFIERCIRGLELNTADATKNVDPSNFSPSMWTWMKRYRVWEANREVFLWPENWLYPELRDDQSPIFQTVMSKLLQSDITEDTATEAYLEYLSELEAVAKLEPCSTYYAPAVTTGSTTSNPITHVIARSTGAQQQYYYRYFDGESWAPWEKVPLTIEGNPVLITVWNNRLMLFWLGVVSTSNSSGNGSSTSSGDGSTKLTDANISDLTAVLTPDPSLTLTTIQMNLFWSEYYNGKWQGQKSSDQNHAPIFVTVASTGPYAFDRSQLSLRAYLDPNAGSDASQDRLWLTVEGVGTGWLTFTFYNTHSAPVPNASNFPEAVVAPDPYDRGVELSPSGWPPGAPYTLSAGYMYDDGTTVNWFSNTIIETKVNPLSANSIVPQDPIRPDPSGIDWVTPFFYSDTCNTFCVETDQTQELIRNFTHYGISGYLAPAATVVPPLTLKNVTAYNPPIPRPAPVETQQGVSISDRVAIARFVSEDAYITRGLGTIGRVKYGSATIGVSGSIANAEDGQ